MQMSDSGLPDIELIKGLSHEEKLNWVSYLYAKPKKETSILSLRHHIIGLYDPFARRKDFPAGRRWCVNVYTGCSFSCKYCYTTNYIRESFRARSKKDFTTLLLKDLNELERSGLNQVPLHISNSTDPLQALEKKYKHTLFLLECVSRKPLLFSTVTMLTRNPSLLCVPEYLDIIKSMKNFQVEVTCPFYDDNTRKFFEPGAPSVQQRLEAMGKLREASIRVALRIDPIFPRDPLPKAFFEKPRLADYGAPKAHTVEGIKELIQFAAGIQCTRIITSPLKLTFGRFANTGILQMYRDLFAAANKGSIIKKGPSFRMPMELYRHWIAEPSMIAGSMNIPMVYCKKNLVDTY